jgi:hypothetical protein
MRIIAIALVTASGFTLAACGGSPAASPSPAASTPAAADSAGSVPDPASSDGPATRKSGQTGGVIPSARRVGQGSATGTVARRRYAA